MKKLLSILALALCFVACQNDQEVGVSNADLVDVVLNLEAPELDATRADNDGKNGGNSAYGGIDFMTDADWANYDIRYILEVYSKDAQDNDHIVGQRMVNCLDKYAPTNFKLRLVPNRDYKFVVFADYVAEGSAEAEDKLAIADLFYDTKDLHNISCITGTASWTAMNEVRDAYFIKENVSANDVKANFQKTLILKRPFGKLRVVTTDIDQVRGYADPGYVEIEYHTNNVYKSFNAVTGKLNETYMSNNELKYGYNIAKWTPYNQGHDADLSKQTLFADYLLAKEGEDIPVSFKMNVYESKGGREIHSIDFCTSVRVQRNHLTTIIGDLLTTQANITIDVNDDFDDPDYGFNYDSDTPALATPKVEAEVEGNVVTLTWAAVENAYNYSVTVGTEMPVVVEEPKYVFTGEYETEYTFQVTALPEDENAYSPATAVFTVTTDKEPAFEPEASEWAVVGVFSSWADQAMYTTPDANVVVLEKVEMKAAEGFLVRKPSTEWADKYGAGGVNYIKANHYITTTKDGGDMCLEADGTYDIYFNISTKALYVMESGKAYAEATEQTVNGEEPKQEEPEVTEKVVYLKPNANWKESGARFAAYFFNGAPGEKWVSMTAVEDGIYQVNLPEGYDYGCDIIFCRMNPGTTANNWNNKWNQTSDLKTPTDGKNRYTVKEGTWDKGGGTWDTYTPAVVEPTEPVALATPEVDAKVEGNVVTLTWAAVENAAQYGITVGTEMPVFVEETTYVFTGEYETEYTFNVVAVPADEEKFAVSEAAVVTVSTEAAPVVGPTYTTVAEFLAAEIDDTTFYTLKGTITRVANTSYGNFDLTDETGTIYVYGLYSEDGVTSKYWAASGAKLGDDIVISAKRDEYNGSAQAGSARFMGLTSPGTLAFWTFSKTATTFTSVGGEQVIDVEAYNLTDAITVASDNAQFTGEYADGKLTIYAAENTTTDTINGNITVTAGALKQVITVAQGGASVGGGTEVVAEATMKDFGWANSAAVTEAKIDDNVTVKFFQGGASTAPAYYTSGEAVRLYQNGAYMTVSANGKTIKSMEITFGSNMYYVAADSGELTEEATTRTWTGDATEVKITCTGTDKNHRAYIAAIKVTYID
ncbi:MAG: hypothetical protein J6Q95_04505 [Alistipes sp.]|nr:hypothetical protein [Alistipes sp.]